MDVPTPLDRAGGAAGEVGGGRTNLEGSLPEDHAPGPDRHPAALIAPHGTLEMSTQGIAGATAAINAVSRTHPEPKALCAMQGALKRARPGPFCTHLSELQNQGG